MVVNQALLLSGIALALSLLAIVVLVLLLIKFNRKQVLLTTQVQANELMLDNLQSSLSEQQKLFTESLAHSEEQIIENGQIIKQLDYRIKNLQQQAIDQKTLFEQYQNQQPEDKLYTRALKLVELGADVEEIITTCEIPKAEAEMLMSVHRKKT